MKFQRLEMFGSLGSSHWKLVLAVCVAGQLRLLAAAPPDPLVRRAQVLLDQGKGVAAMELLEAAAVRNPGNAEAFNGLGNLYMAKGDMEKAGESYWKAVELEPGNADYRTNLGVFDGRIGRDDAAVRCFAHALKLNPGHRGALLNAGDFALRFGKADEAAGYYDRLLKLNPSDADTLYRKGLVLRGRGDLAGAAKAYAAAVTVRPAFADARADLAYTYLELKDAEKALRHFQVVVSQQPLMARAHHGAGLCWKAMDRPDDAAKCFAEAAQIEADNVDHFVQMAFVLAEQRTPEKVARAETILQGALKLNPGDPQGNFMAGVFYDGLGRAEDATQYFQRAVALGHANPQAKLYLAENHLKLGRRLSAESLLQELMSTLPAGNAVREKAKALLGAS